MCQSPQKRMYSCCLSASVYDKKFKFMKQSQKSIKVMENFFCIYFSVEWLIRLLAFKYKRNCLRDSWFVLDTILVLFMVTETWVITLVVLLLGGDASSISNVAVIRIARVSRITRMARMGRLLKLMPELLILLKGISAAARPVAFTLMLLCCVTYLFGITFRQITDGTAVGSQFFPSVVASMHTLLLYGTLLDNISEVVRELEAENVALVVVFYFFVLLASLTITNLLIGVLCEVVTAVAATEKEQLTVQFMKTQLTSILASIGVDPSAEAPVISKEHLTRMLDKPEVCRTLTEVGVDVLVLVDNIEFIFAPDPMDEALADDWIY
ncbi:Scn11a [Symbiodinium natans]|uniref:Scn11a protein n=1 Tax=Symbiodinium natans TaxID=878477 RepID=A0A812L6W9_9DINO|nr:Scn11a [Symbiodinium natans]